MVKAQDSMCYTKKETPYEELGIHTKPPSGYAFIEAHSDISALMLDNSNVLLPSLSMKNGIIDEEEKEEQAKTNIKKSSSIRALLRSQVMYGQQK